MPRSRALSHARKAISTLAVLAVAATMIAVSSTPAAAVECNGGPGSDFDGDGLSDLAIGDPRATVANHSNAGRVHVMYGDGTSQTLTQNDDFLGGWAAEPGDQFGYALASVDWNGDGCSDLVVSAPREALGDKQQAGAVLLIPGSPQGLGQAGFSDFLATQAPYAGTDPTGDWFGRSLAAGTTTSGQPFLVFGIPKREVQTSSGLLEEAGAIGYARGSARALTHQNSPGAFGIAEAGDLFGFSVSASGRYVAAGSHAETVGQAIYSGTAAVFKHTMASGALTAVGGVDQSAPSGTSSPAPDDWFGRTLSMTDYLDSTGAPATLLIIGVPGEDIHPEPGTVTDAGRIVKVSADGDLTELGEASQDSDGVDGGSEIGDLFGSTVTAVNRDPGTIASWDTLLFAVGSPGEDLDQFSDSGAVQVFSGLGAPGDHDVTITADHLAGTGFAWESGTGLGDFIHASPSHLFIANPWSADPAVYGIPWDNLLTGVTGGVLVYKPGSHGLPSDGVALFGAALA